MVVVGSNRTGAELRKKPRQPFHYRASILTPSDPTPRSCSIADISETGAKVSVEIEHELPDQFILFLTPNGATRRLCQVIWRNGLTVGVRFIRGDE
jgi:hypothetical protein